MVDHAAPFIDHAAAGIDHAAAFPGNAAPLAIKKGRGTISLTAWRMYFVPGMILAVVGAFTQEGDRG